MSDPVFEGFLRQQLHDGVALTSQSDLLDLTPLEIGDRPPRRYLAKFFCTGLVSDQKGNVSEASEFHVGIWFPSDYLRRVDPFQVLTWLHPSNVWHPNIGVGLCSSGTPPAICAGRIVPGTELIDLLYDLFEIITYRNWAPHDGLNPSACQWARNNQKRFPTDSRPLKRRALTLDVREMSES
ncbi:MAG TPA: hypothetical protein DD670_03730 [Planctomycetaceae bacterium]|nr:hypothetical protein [Planctomycetaceae bacterium]